MFDFLRKKKQSPKRPTDPLELYDQVIASLEKRCAQIRKSAATLLAMRGELTREVERLDAREVQLTERIERAARQGDAKVERALRRDLGEAAKHRTHTVETLASATSDAELLLSAAESVTGQLAALKAERQGAAARVTSGAELNEALRAQAEEVDRALKLDAARDEVEKAHALADLYREEAAARSR